AVPRRPRSRQPEGRREGWPLRRAPGIPNRAMPKTGGHSGSSAAGTARRTRKRRTETSRSTPGRISEPATTLPAPGPRRLPRAGKAVLARRIAVRPTRTRTAISAPAPPSCVPLDQRRRQQRNHDLVMPSNRVPATARARVRAFHYVGLGPVVLQEIEIDGGEIGERVPQVPDHGDRLEKH